MKKKRKPGQGRKPLDGVTDTKRYAVYLDDSTAEKAQQISGGTISAGLRMAVAEYKIPGRKKPKTAPAG